MQQQSTHFQRVAWTSERVARLRKLYKEGNSAAQIARAFGDVSRSAVIGKLFRLGLTCHSGAKRKVLAAPHKRAQGKAKPSRPSGRVARRDNGHAKPRPVLRDVKLAPDAVVPGPHIALMEAGRNQCRWPVSGSGVALLVCGASANGPYCAQHAKRAYTGTVRGDAARRKREGDAGTFTVRSRGFRGGF